MSALICLNCKWEQDNQRLTCPRCGCLLSNANDMKPERRPVNPDDVAREVIMPRYGERL